MVRSFKLLLAAVALLAVMCAGAAFAADPVEVDLKMGFLHHSLDNNDPTTSPLPNNELRLWVTRRVGSIEKEPQLIDTKGHKIAYGSVIMFATKPTAGSAEGKWLSERVVQAGPPPYTTIEGSGVIGSGIEYEVGGPNITLLASGNAVSGDKATIYVYGGMMDDPNAPGTQITSVQVYDGNDRYDVTPFPDDVEIARDVNDKNGRAFTSFDVIVLSSDAELILDQIEASPDLELAEGSNVVVKDAADIITDVVRRAVPQPPVITVELAGNGSEIVVVSADADGNIGRQYLENMDPNDARAYLKDGDATIYTFTPVIDRSGTITYRMDDPGLLQVLKDRLDKDLTIWFGDLNATHGMNLPSCPIKFTLSLGGGWSSSGSSCAAGAFVPFAIAALAMIKRRTR